MSTQHRWKTDDVGTYEIVMFVCDECGKKELGKVWTEGVQYLSPAFWRKTKNIGMYYMDLCPTCVNLEKFNDALDL